MNDVSLHLVDNVLPAVPLRQWVCTLPWNLRARVGYDREACALFVSTFAKALSRRMRWRAKKELGLSSLNKAHVGMLTFVQRSDSALRLNPHLHTLMLDGVYVFGAHGLRFEPVTEPSPEEVAQVAEQTAKALFAKLDIDWDEQLMSDEPLLSHVYQHSAGGSDALGPRIGAATVRLIDSRYVRSAQAGPLRVDVQGLGVYADRVIRAEDKEARLRLCRYLSRPPLKAERLRRNHDGRLLYALKRPWADGTTAVAFHPLDFISRLCALVPPPRFHLLRFFGVLSAHSALRAQVVPGPGIQSESATARQLVLPGLGPPAEPANCNAKRANQQKPKRTPWAKLLARVFEVDVTICPRCFGEMKIRAFVTDPDEVLRYLQLGARAPPSTKQPSLALCDGPQLALRFV